MRDRLKNGVEMLAGAAQLSLDFGHALLNAVADAISGRDVPRPEPNKHSVASLPPSLRHPSRTTDDDRPSKIA